MLSLPRTWVQSVVGELRSPKRYVAAKEKNRKHHLHLHLRFQRWCLIPIHSGVLWFRLGCFSFDLKKKIVFSWRIFAPQYCVGFCHRVASQLSLLPACFILLSTSQVIYPSAFELPKFCRCSPLFHSLFLLFRLFKETLSRGGKGWEFETSR